MQKIGKIFITIGLVLIIISIFFFVYYNYEEKKAYQEAQTTLDVIKSNLEENDFTINNNLIKEEINKMKVANINGYDYIGTIIIPSLNLELPVMSECDYKRLKKAPCKYYGSIYTNDLIICGHSYKKHFKYLNNLNYQDKVIFIDIDNKQYFYEVIKKEILNPDEVSSMINNDFDLTLYTCTNGGLKRIAIRCNRVFDYSDS